VRLRAAALAPALSAALARSLACALLQTLPLAATAAAAAAAMLAAPPGGAAPGGMGPAQALALLFAFALLACAAAPLHALAPLLITRSAARAARQRVAWLLSTPARASSTALSVFVPHGQRAARDEAALQQLHARVEGGHAASLTPY
jgi:hypothetical protein